MRIIAFFILVIFSFSTQAAVMLKVGDKAPDFTLSDPSGKPIHLYDFKGKVVLLDFWASWCGPCRTANKELIKLYKEFNPQGFEIFSVSLDSKKENWLNAIEKDKLIWPNHASDLREWESAPAQLFSINEIPTTFLLDENGIILAKSHNVQEIREKLNYIYFEQSNAYPLNTSDKIYFNQKSKFEVSDTAGKVVAKGKDNMLDVNELVPGEYLLKYEEKMVFFHKLPKSLENIKMDTIPSNGQLNLSKETSYEIFNQFGKLVSQGKGNFVPVQTLIPGNYFININGLIHPYLKN